MSSSKGRGWESFLKLCCEVQSSVELNELLELFLTSEERNTLALRVELVSELLKGERTQRDISAELEISIAKITRGSNALKIISNSLRRFLLKYLL